MDESKDDFREVGRKQLHLWGVRHASYHHFDKGIYSFGEVKRVNFKFNKHKNHINTL